MSWKYDGMRCVCGDVESEKHVLLDCNLYVDVRRRWKEKMNAGSKRHSLQAVELSQWLQAAVQIVSNLPAPNNGGPIYRFFGMPAMRTRWMAGAAAHKSG